jgi:hypothetical protein
VANVTPTAPPKKSFLKRIPELNELRENKLISDALYQSKSAEILIERPLT